jgi:4-amino-4-deoxy-L-arabinose transferase-like glycosyltransferase
VSVVTTAVRPSDETVQPARRSFLLLLGCIAALGFVARVLYVLLARHRVVGGDGFAYSVAAHDLVNGLGFINSFVRVTQGVIKPDAQHPPGWLLLLAGATAAGLRTVLWQQLFACTVGAATIVVTGLAGRAVAGRRAGLIAASLTAVYPNVWIYERELAAETLALLGVAVVILFAYRLRSRPGLLRAVLLGLAVGLLALTRSEQLALLFVLVLPLVLGLRTASMRQRLMWLVAAGLTAAVVIAPWSVYNTHRFHHRVVLSTGLGIAMRQGACDQAFSGTDMGYRTWACILSDDVPSNPASADTRYRHYAREYLRDHPARTVVVVAAREGRTFGYFRPAQQLRLDGQRGTNPWILRVGFAAYWLLLLLAVIGGVVLRRRRVPIYPLLAVPLTVAISTALTFGQTRYRGPAEIALVLLAAVGIDNLTEQARRRRAAHPTRDPEVSASGGPHENLVPEPQVPA